MDALTTENNLTALKQLVMALVILLPTMYLYYLGVLALKTYIKKNSK